MTYITPPVALVFIPTAAIVLLLSACFAGKLRGRLSPAQNCQHLAGALCVAVLVIGTSRPRRNGLPPSACSGSPSSPCAAT
jgi:hypothetical protein